VEFVSFDSLLRESDVVTVHCPLNADSAGMFGAEAFRKMKPAALFINTARGGVVQEAALAAALNGGIIGGAAVDVLAVEPMAADCPLRGAKNLIFTPHVAWAPVETRRRLIGIVAENIQAFLDGRPIRTVQDL
jgi:glycerate dehydrogenase